MSRIPKNPEEIFPDIIKDCSALFADDLVSIILYGSAASGDYVSGKSDINLMIVLSDAGIDRIDQVIRGIALGLHGQRRKEWRPQHEQELDRQPCPEMHAHDVPSPATLSYGTTPKSV